VSHLALATKLDTKHKLAVWVPRILCGDRLVSSEDDSFRSILIIYLRMPASLSKVRWWEYYFFWIAVAVRCSCFISCYPWVPNRWTVNFAPLGYLQSSYLLKHIYSARLNCLHVGKPCSRSRHHEVRSKIDEACLDAC